MMMKIPPRSPCRSSLEQGEKLPISAMYSPIAGVARVVASISAYTAIRRLKSPYIVPYRSIT